MLLVRLNAAVQRSSPNDLCVAIQRLSPGNCRARAVYFFRKAACTRRAVALGKRWWKNGHPSETFHCAGHSLADFQAFTISVSTPNIRSQTHYV